MSRENPATIELNSVTAKSVLDENGDQSGSKEVFRSQQSLGLITQRFMNLRQRNEIMNLNEVAKELNISKRRVYDVINVLEGLGYVQKVEKNNIQWIGDSNKTEDQDKLEARVELLRQQEKVLEMMIKDAQAIIGLHFEDPISRPYNYVRKEDIRNTADPETKSIIVKSDIDSSSSFEVQVTDPSTSGSYDMIVRNKNGVKSHALLFTNDLLRENQAEYLKEGGDIDDGQMNVTLADISSEVISNEAKPEIGDLDTEDLETFVLPSSSSRQPDAPYVPETPGRGLFFSPFKTLIDPCILPSYSDDLSSGFINITTPSRIMAEQSTTERDEEPGSVMDFFSD